MRGFILQPTYRVESGLPVVHLYGRLEDGHPFLIRDGSQIPHFFIRQTDIERARSLGAAKIRPERLVTMDGEPVARVEVAIPAETPPLRDRLTGAGIPAFEADVRFAMRFLIDRSIKGGVEIEGGFRDGAAFPADLPAAPTGDGAPKPMRIFEAPSLSPAEWAPALRVLSLDIETDPRARRVFSVALHGEGIEEVLYVTPGGPGARREEALREMRIAAGTPASGSAGAGPQTSGAKEDIRPLDGAPAAEGAGDAGRATSSGRGSGGTVEGVAPRREAARAPRSRDFVAVACSTEAELIDTLCARVAAFDPDVLTGWNVVDFDLRVLDEAARRAGRRLRLGRTGEGVRIRIEEGTWRSSRAEVVGRVVLDGIDLLRGAFVKLEDYRLETAARALLGKGKLLAGAHRAEEIERLYREDLPRFLEYNLTDARLVTEILETTGVVRLAVGRSLLTGMPPDRVGASIASFDALYLPELRRRGVVAPSVGSVEAVEATAGGAVLEPVTGLHDNVLVFDFRSLYPSLIRTYNIDPLGLIRDHAMGEDFRARTAEAGDRREGPGTARAPRRGDRAFGGAHEISGAGPHEPGGPGVEPIRAPNGALFRREPGILPGLLDRLFAERAGARLRGDAIASQAIKILMNSCYGVLATPACRFYSSAVANAITHFGQATLMWTRERAEAGGYRVLYGDTDSLFVAAGTPDPQEAAERGKKLLAGLNLDLTEHVRGTHGVRSRLELEFQCLYRKLFLPSVRHGTAGARKRYAGLVVENGRESIHFTGMEMVRRDWTELSKIFQRGLFERVFHDQDPAPFIRGFVEELKEGRHDDHLVYRKALRKKISEYTATTPPHVKAAKLLGARPGQLIDYVVTVNGPEPASMRTGSFDYAHYIDRQIRPVAEALLVHLGQDFDEVAGTGKGGGRQMSLFG